MKTFISFIMCIAMACTACSASSNDKELTGETQGHFTGKKVLVAYFSWGGTTKKVAEEIVRITGADIYRIEPAVPYPTEYTPCTEVAKEERDNDARPAIKNKVDNWNDYDIVFIGCPVWWHTAPMIISTFAESYNFKGKTVVPFCTYASTYRDETLQKIVDLTPDAIHLTGFGSTGSTSGVANWIEQINREWGDKYTAISTPAVDEESITPEYFSLNGIKLAQAQSAMGIVIERTANGYKKVVR